MVGHRWWRWRLGSKSLPALVLCERQRCSSQAPMERVESSFDFLTRRFRLATPFMAFWIISTFPGVL